MRRFFLYNTFICILVCIPLYGQNLDKVHEILLNDKVTTSGEVLSFFSFSNGESTLIVKDLKQGKTFMLQGVNAETVISKKFIMAHNYTDSKLYTIDLSRSVVDTLIGVTRLERIKGTNNVVIEQKGKKKLTIIHVDTGKTSSFDNVKKWFHTENRNIYMLGSLNEITLLDIKTLREKIRFRGIPSEYKVKKVIGNHSIHEEYVLANKGDSIHIFSINDTSLRKVFQYVANSTLKNFKTDTLFRKTRLLKNGRILLGIIPMNENSQKLEKLEIWKSSDNYLPNEMDKSLRLDKRFVMIDVKRKKIIDLNVVERNSEFIVNACDDRVYELEMNDPEFMSKQFSDVKLYTVDADTQLRHFIGIINGANYTVYQTAHFPYFFYFKGHHWLYYDPTTNQHINLTEGLDDTFYNMDNEFASVKKDEGYRSFGVMGNKLVFNGYRDIWFFDTVTGEMRKITDGKKTGVRYTVDGSSFQSQRKNFALNYENEIPEGSSILVKWVKDDYGEEGFALIDNKGIVQNLMSEKAHLSQVKYSENYFTYLKERADTPQQLYRYDLKEKTTKLVYTSNTNDTNATNIKSVYISFNNSQGKKRGAVVRFSKNLKAGHKYPAIVNIYEKKYQKQHHYTSPYEIIGGEINIRKYIEDGYVIIEPDIYYEMGNTGGSAVDNVIDVINEIIERFPVDKELLGIFGHSFGGYETNFIITQTNCFKAAVSSAGVADLRSFYFTVNWETVKADMWRMETQQWRMGKGYYEMRGGYSDNSPVEHIEKVQTPLLLISGKEDYQINWQQSVMMFLALKRLKKETELLLYPNEGHVLMKKENQLDADKRIKQWFDKYLKK